ncbi:MAG: hypothetical protein HY231_04875 [Acidobacteria bacterium]|nr:hypothetical protein [Acidobacteriota bacterium]
MSSFNETTNSTTASSSEADEVRRVFAALPFEQRLATLFKVELDLVADVVENVAAAVSNTVDEVADYINCVVSSDHPAPDSADPTV